MTTININDRVYDGGPASLQRYFDETIEHLVTQGKKATAGGGQCRYRTEEGESCAVGCHIPDDLYSPRFEGAGLKAYGTHVTLRGIAFPDSREGVELALALQRLHDGASGLGFGPGFFGWDRARQRAVNFNLNTNVVDLYEYLSLLTPEHIERLKIADALESGKYTQARSVLRQHLSTGDAHCCLGVGCDLSGFGVWAEPDVVYGTHVRYEFGDPGMGASVDSMPPEELKVRWFGDTNDAETTAGMMAGLNDYVRGEDHYPWGFPEIAKLFRLNGGDLDEAVDFHMGQGGFQERSTWIERFPFLATDDEVVDLLAANVVLGDE